MRNGECTNEATDRNRQPTKFHLIEVTKPYDSTKNDPEKRTKNEANPELKSVAGWIGKPGRWIRSRGRIYHLTRRSSVAAGSSKLCFTLNYHFSTPSFLSNTASGWLQRVVRRIHVASPSRSLPLRTFALEITNLHPISSNSRKAFRSIRSRRPSTDGYLK